MNDFSAISAITKPHHLKMTSQTEASLTAPESTSMKKNEMLTQLKEEIHSLQSAYQRATELSNFIDERLKEYRDKL